MLYYVCCQKWEDHDSNIWWCYKRRILLIQIVNNSNNTTILLIRVLNIYLYFLLQYILRFHGKNMHSARAHAFYCWQFCWLFVVLKVLKKSHGSALKTKSADSATSRDSWTSELFVTWEYFIFYSKKIKLYRYRCPSNSCLA